MNDVHIDHLPFAFEGVDAIFHSVFHYLGLKMTIKAAIKRSEDEDRYES